VTHGWGRAETEEIRAKEIGTGGEEAWRTSENQDTGGSTLWREENVLPGPLPPGDGGIRTLSF